MVMLGAKCASCASGLANLWQAHESCQQPSEDQAPCPTSAQTTSASAENRLIFTTNQLQLVPSGVCNGVTTLLPNRKKTPCITFSAKVSKICKTFLQLNLVQVRRRLNVRLEMSSMSFCCFWLLHETTMASAYVHCFPVCDFTADCR